MSTPPVVFLHGLGQTPLTWEAQVEALPPGRSALAPWLRGLRPGDEREFTLGGAAADVITQLDMHPAARGHLAGLSLGTMVALSCALDFPDRVASLILAAGQVTPPRALIRAQRAVLRLMPSHRFAAGGVSKARMLQVLAQLDDAGLAERLDQVSAPTLVLVGEQDRVNQPAARQLAEGIPGARLERVARAGYQVNADAPEAFNALLYDFVREAESRA